MRGKHVRACQWVNPFRPARNPCEVALTGGAAVPSIEESISRCILAPLVPRVSGPARLLRLPILVSDREGRNCKRLKAIMALTSLAGRAENEGFAPVFPYQPVQSFERRAAILMRFWNSPTHALQGNSLSEPDMLDPMARRTQQGEVCNRGVPNALV